MAWWQQNLLRECPRDQIRPSLDAVDRSLSAQSEQPSQACVGLFGRRAGATRYLQAGQGPGRALPLGGYDPSSLQHTAASRLDFDYVVTADIWQHKADMNKVGLFQVEIFDLRFANRRPRLITQAMLVEIKRIHRQASKPAAAPAL